MRLPLNTVVEHKVPLLLLHSLSTATVNASVEFRNVLNPPRRSLTLARTRKLRFLHCRAMATASELEPLVVPVKDKIELTETGQKIFDRLLGTLCYFNLQTQLHVAGGWLLGKECYDIDIALENMLGSEFVDKVREYLESTGEEAQGLAVIPSNPGQSKHLETARMRLFDLWIDFVNLRCEDYSENSRIPTMKFGTAEENAYQRDLTINSLFYNINTSVVEDFTKRGIADLKSGKIVTPLPPKATFLDDPLRVLRAIRFGARFGFTLDEELKKAAACDDVKAALAANISRERIGTEIDLMISGNHPNKAMAYICNLTLFWIVFNLPHEFEPALPEECHRLCIAYMDAAWNVSQLIGCINFNIPVVNYIMRDSLKRKVSDAETVLNIHNALEKFLPLIPSCVSNEDAHFTEVEWGRELIDVPGISKLRVLTGFLLREIKDFWQVALLLSTLLYPADTDYTQDMLNKHFELEKRRDLFVTVENAIVKLGLEKVWDLKPLVNGKDIMDILQLKAGGPLVRQWQQKLLAWQLAHPSSTTEECLNWMRETHSKHTEME